MSTAPAASSQAIGWISSFLQNGPLLQNFTFPRCHLPNLSGYSPIDYAEVGRKIARGTIPVVMGEGEIEGAKAFYHLKSNVLTLTSKTDPLNTPEHWATIVHEATHIIQDGKKWRIALVDMEVDAHFAQALFLYYKGRSLGGHMDPYDTAAKAFATGNKNKFKQKIGEMRVRAGVKYQYKEGYEKMYIPERQNGN